MDLVVALNIGLAATALCIALLTQRRTLMRALRRRRLRRVGVDGTARVLAVRETSSRVNGQPLADLRLQVADGNGGFEASSQVVMSPVSAPLYSPGRMLRVRFDPARPAEVAVLGPAP